MKSMAISDILRGMIGDANIDIGHRIEAIRILLDNGYSAETLVPMSDGRDDEPGVLQ